MRRCILTIDRYSLSVTDGIKGPGSAPVRPVPSVYAWSRLLSAAALARLPPQGGPLLGAPLHETWPATSPDGLRLHIMGS